MLMSVSVAIATVAVSTLDAVEPGVAVAVGAAVGAPPGAPPPPGMPCAEGANDVVAPQR